jgi:catechol 2,3-dioxygenase-like lactoylglutathione lyase family enzyme
VIPEALIDRITLVVADVERAEQDYAGTFGCVVERRGDIEPALTAVLCVRPARGRRSLLRLGRERIELLEFTDSMGRPYPPDSTSTDLWFQHMAIVVNDMTSAHRLVMANRRFRPISRNGPVRLPDSSGGLTAFKFRDHDGHPLELLAFPDSRIPLAWREPDGSGPFVGIDHTAIAVSDADRTAGFFRSVFGFTEGTGTENRGPEQADLDDVEDVRVSVRQIAPDLPAPRLELLRYHTGPRRLIPRDTASNDIVATHSVIRVASLDATAAALARRGTPLALDMVMNLTGGMRAALVTGPDGHRFLVEERPSVSSLAGGGRAAKKITQVCDVLGRFGRQRAPMKIAIAVGVAAGMAIFVAVSPPTGGVSVPGIKAWTPALAAITALAVLSAAVGLRSRGTARVIWLAAATAVIYALVNALTKNSVGLLMHQGAGVLATWQLYALMAAGIISGLFG